MTLVYSCKFNTSTQRYAKCISLINAVHILLQGKRGKTKMINLSHGLTVKNSSLISVIFLVKVIDTISHESFHIKNSFTLSKQMKITT